MIVVTRRHGETTASAGLELTGNCCCPCAGCKRGGKDHCNDGILCTMGLWVPVEFRFKTIKPIMTVVLLEKQLVLSIPCMGRCFCTAQCSLDAGHHGADCGGHRAARAIV